MTDSSSTTPGGEAVEFFFDPVCPWTWATSRWLVTVAGGHQAVTWRSLSLAVVNRDREVPEQYRAPMAASRGALRLVEALRAAGRGHEVGGLYTELGRRFHHDQVVPSHDEVRAAAHASGVGDLVDAVDDAALDAALEASVAEARSLAGDDAGSPVLALGSPRRGFFGPIVTTPPTGDEAARLWRAVRDLASIPAFAELKTARSGRPNPGPRP